MTNQVERILRGREVDRVCGLSPSAREREVRAGRFPRPFKLSADPKCRSVGWAESDIQRWIAERKASSEGGAA